MDDDKVIGFSGGPLDGDRITVDSLPPIYEATLDDGTVARYESVGTGRNIGSDPMVMTYRYVEG